MVMAGAVLWNWRLVDTSALASTTVRPTTDNSSMLVSLAGGQDELWFFTLSLEVVRPGCNAPFAVVCSGCCTVQQTVDTS